MEGAKFQASIQGLHTEIQESYLQKLGIPRPFLCLFFYFLPWFQHFNCEKVHLDLKP